MGEGYRYAQGDAATATTNVGLRRGVASAVATPDRNAMKIVIQSPSKVVHYGIIWPIVIMLGFLLVSWVIIGIVSLIHAL